MLISLCSDYRQGRLDSKLGWCERFSKGLAEDMISEWIPYLAMEGWSFYEQ